MPTVLKDSQVSVRLPNELTEKMQAYAQLTGRTKSYVAMEALTVYLEDRVPQIEELKGAVLEADHGEFASDEEVAAVFAKYSGRGSSRATRKPPATRGLK